MAKVKMLLLYQQIAAGKRVVNIPSADLPALAQWLHRNGYSRKTNIIGNRAEVLIDKK
jgi:hypothetical protein